jgi:hypothetical protein
MLPNGNVLYHSLKALAGRSGSGTFGHLREAAILRRTRHLGPSFVRVARHSAKVGTCTRRRLHADMHPQAPAVIGVTPEGVELTFTQTSSPPSLAQTKNCRHNSGKPNTAL